MKTFLPTRDIAEFYRYKIQENSIKVYTNFFRDNTQQDVTCYEVYPHMDYLKSNDEVCSVIEMNNANLDFNSFTSDIYYRLDLDKILIIFLILFIFCILIPYKIFSRFFGRWLKI